MTDLVERLRAVVASKETAEASPNDRELRFAYFESCFGALPDIALAADEIVRLRGINSTLCDEKNALLLNGSDWQDRAEAAEAALAALTRPPSDEKRNEILEEAAQCCRDEMERARGLAKSANFENPALAVQAQVVTIGREDSASRILSAIRALSTKKPGATG